jgi:hypothetical protein
MSRAEFESLKRESAERGEAAQYWSGLHRTAARTAEPAADEDEDVAREFLEADEPDGIDGDTPEKLVDDFAAKGVAALKSRGFITAKDAQKLAVETALKVSREMIGRERTKITSDATLMNEFPELKDQASDLFKETAKRYQKAVAMDPGAKRTPAALYLAADAARESLKARAPVKRRNEDDDYEPEHESDRRRRADSQDSRPNGRGQAADRDDMLGDEARQVIKAMGISEAEFKASQKDTGSMGRRKR